jgi:predicted phage terminase large subunit-like protein
LSTLEKILRQPINENELAASICKDSFFEFVQEFWREVVNEVPVWNWHIEYLSDLLQGIAERVKRREPAEYDYYIINIPPGSSKSTIVSIMYPMWCWSIDPTQRFICSSYANDIALDLAEKSRRVFRSEKYQKYFPDVRIDQENESKSRFKNLVGGERYATSTGANITGVHAHQIIIDDPINPMKAASEVERNTANKYIDETLSTRKVDKLMTPTIMIMQRLHENDCTGHLIAKGVNVLYICLPAEESEYIRPQTLRKYYSDGLFDPVRLNRSAISKLRLQLGSYGASGQLDQLPSPAEGGILKKAWFEIVDKNIPRNATVKFKIDTAYTDKQKNDPSGFFAYYVENGFMYVVNAEEQFLEFPELKKYIPVYCNTHGYSARSTIKVEPKASGKSVVQELKNIPNLNILEDRIPKDDKVTRANAASPICESGKVKLHRGAWNDYFLNQIAAFPNGLHDEQVDNLSSAVKEEYINNRDDYQYKRVN